MADEVDALAALPPSPRVRTDDVRSDADPFLLAVGGVADLPQGQAVRWGDLAGGGPIPGDRARPRRSPGVSLPRPTSTSVPTIERTIWWQNALARISKRRMRRLVGDLGPAGGEHAPDQRRLGLAGLDLGAPAERCEVVLAEQRVAGRRHRPAGEWLGDPPRPAGEQRVRRRGVPHVVAVPAPRRREPGVEVARLPTTPHGRRSRGPAACSAAGRRRRGRGRRADRPTPPGPRRALRRRSARHRSGQRAGGRSSRGRRSARRAPCARRGSARTRGTPPRRRRRSTAHAPLQQSRGRLRPDPGRTCDQDPDVNAHTSSMRAISAASPWRAPSLRIRV